MVHGGMRSTPDSVHFENELIRQHSPDDNRWLFDIADIEAHDRRTDGSHGVDGHSGIYEEIVRYPGVIWTM